jgi:hypothetical protein
MLCPAAPAGESRMTKEGEEDDGIVVPLWLLLPLLPPLPLWMLFPLFTLWDAAAGVFALSWW